MSEALQPQIPFPVSDDHRIRPDLKQYEGPLFYVDNERERYLAEKKLVSAEPWAALLSSEANQDPSAVIFALQWLRAQKQQSHPFLHEKTDVVAGQLVTPQRALDLGRHLALGLQEDIALMHGTRLEAAWVMLPSRWNPAEKIGLDFAQIHTPVPHSTKLQASQQNLAKAMSQKGPFVRYVWGLSYDPNLCQHPSKPRWDSGDTVYFRTERQITVPLPELGRSWFLIRVYNVPLEQVIINPERKAMLANALRSMNPEHMAYKDMAHLIPRVLQELEPRG